MRILSSAVLCSLFVFIFGKVTLLRVIGTDEVIRTELSVDYALEEAIFDEELFEYEGNRLQII